MILLGASGHGKVIADILKLSGEADIVFWDDNPNASVPGFTVYPKGLIATDRVIISIGDNATRKKITKTYSYSYGRALHPSLIAAKDVTIGSGSVVMAAVVINTGASIGMHCIVNSAAVIEHDSVIKDFVHISPNATLAGNVTVNEGAWIGAGATIIQGITIGCWAIVGAGAVVVRDIPDFAVVVGNPAKVIRNNNI